MQLPPIEPGDEERWVRTHLDDLCCNRPAASPQWPGTQAAADRALERLDLRGYASDRSTVSPTDARGATGLSPYIRHGLITLDQAWQAADPARTADRDRFRDELRWQEYARHLAARVPTDRPWRHRPIGASSSGARDPDPWSGGLACVDLAIEELHSTGWIPNQARLWLASHWAVRHQADWRSGEDQFFTHLLDGSRAANRLGWQWVAGTATGRPHPFARGQVERAAPGLCDSCRHRDQCPIEHPPTPPELEAVDDVESLRRDPDPDRAAGPSTPDIRAEPEAIWITAESIGDRDPALGAHTDVPVVFVFDEPLLRRLQLSGHRLVFLAQRLAELGRRRDLEIRLGFPVVELDGRAVAATFTPVPGWHRRSADVDIVALHPWPWLRRPNAGSVASFSAWSTSHGEQRRRGR